MFYAWIHLRSWSIIYAITVSLNHKGSASFTYTGYRYVKNQCCTLHFLYPRTGYTYIRYICVPDTGPINPHGFLAPFYHLIVYYTDTIIWTWTWTWGSWHLCIVFNTPISSLSRNDRIWKYIFMFHQNNSTPKGSIISHIRLYPNLSGFHVFICWRLKKSFFC